MQNTGGTNDTSNKLEIAHITIDGKEIDEKTYNSLQTSPFYKTTFTSKRPSNRH